MQEQFIKSLRMIKVLGIERQFEYQQLMNDFLVLSLDSLKYISQKDSFSEIVKLANDL